MTPPPVGQLAKVTRWGTALVVGLGRFAAVSTTLVLGTLGSFMVGFGVMTGCTNNYSCGTNGCSPCETTETWLMVGWVAQGVLLLCTLLVMRPAIHRGRLSLMVGLPVVIVLLSVAAIVGTTRMADRSYCRPGEDTPSVTGEPSYCGT
jgi:hypothetical protein